MRILYVGCLPSHRGGSALSAAQVLTALAEAGHRLRALDLDLPQQPPPAEVVSGLPADVSVTRLAMPVYEESPGDNPSLGIRRREAAIVVPALERELDQGLPDALFLGAEIVGHYVPRVARAHGVPCLARMTGSYANRIIEGRQSAEIAEDWLREMRSVERIVCLTEAMRRGLEALELPRVRVIPNGVDLSRFQPRPPDPALRDRLDVPADAPVVLHVSGLKPVKRCLDLIAAAPRLLQREPRLRFLVVGEGSRRAELEAAVDRAGLRDRFRFTGWRPNDAMPDYYALADVVVMPSEREGQSRVYLEAQASGVALAASDIPAARSVVDDGRTGVLFRKGDPDDLAARVATLLADRPLSDRITERALRQVRERHSLDAVAAAYERELEAIRASPRMAKQAQQR